MTHSPTFGNLFGVTWRLHGSWALMIPGVIGYSLYAYSWQAALFYLLLLLATGLCVAVHEVVHVLVAKCFGIGTRDITLYPLWGSARLTHLSERPWQENYISLTGPFTHLLLAGCVGVGLNWAGYQLAFEPENHTYDATLFFLHLFWVNVLLTIFNFLPIFPLDGGVVFRASLALTTKRLRATEVAAVLSTVGALIMLLLAIFWLESPLVGFTAVLIYFAAQEEVRTTRFFDSLTHPQDEPNDPPPVTSAPVNQLTHDIKPAEANYTGFTWNPKLRLWIEWRNGEAIRANALVGE